MLRHSHDNDGDITDFLRHGFMIPTHRIVVSMVSDRAAERATQQ